MDYIFGYGSIINDLSRIQTMNQSPATNSITHIQYGQAGCLEGDSAISAYIKFGYKRSWCFRSSTGFTALGLTPLDESLDGLKVESTSQSVCGVLFPVACSKSLSAFDARESGYERVLVSLDDIDVNINIGSPAARIRAVDLKRRIENLLGSPLCPEEHLEHDAIRVWAYVPDSKNLLPPDEEFPILQTYVDVCVRGCLQWGGPAYAIEFLQSTHGWSEFYLNDAPMSRRPWFHRTDYQAVDDCLQKLSSHVLFHQRKHPEEYAARHLTALRGMWGVPPRNQNFIGRESTLSIIHSKLLGNHDHTTSTNLESMHQKTISGSTDSSNPQGTNSVSDPVSASSTRVHMDSASCSIRQLEIVGLGGLGKTQVITEYVHRHFGACYGLVAWLRAESPASIAADLRRLAFDLGILKRYVAGTEDQPSPSSHETIDDDVVVEEVRRRLSRCQCRWLLVFDNVEDPAIIGSYLPRGVGGHGGAACSGHVISTSRVSMNSWQGPIMSLTLDCFSADESVHYLLSTLGGENGDSYPTDSDPAYLEQLTLLVDRLGNLPLALSIASAYMNRCCVTPAEYLQRTHLLVSSNSQGDSLHSSLCMTLDKIKKESEAAGNTLPCLGFISSDNISKTMVKMLLSTSHFKSGGPCVKHYEDLKRNSQPKYHVLIFMTKVYMKLNNSLVLYWFPVVSMGLCYLLLTGFSLFAFSGSLTSAVSINEWKYQKYIRNVVVTYNIGIHILAILCVLYLCKRTLHYCRHKWRVRQHAFLGIPGDLDMHSCCLPVTYENDTTAVYCSSSPDPRALRCQLSCDVSSSNAIGGPYQDDSGRFLDMKNIIDTETDQVWDLLRQFSLLSVRGPRHHRVGSIHRLQQSILRSRAENEAMCIERCIWMLTSLWTFEPQNNNSCWDHCADLLEHIDAVAKYAHAMLTPGLLSNSKYVIRWYYAVKLVELLTEAGSFSALVLSKFDTAQSFLDAAALAHMKIEEAAASGRYNGYLSTQESLVLAADKATTLHHLGKTLRYNGRLEEGKDALVAALSMRKKFDPDSHSVADTLHELGVIFLKAHVQDQAEFFLTQSLELKQKLRGLWKSKPKVELSKPGNRDDASPFGLSPSSLGNHLKFQESGEAATLHQLAVVAITSKRYDDAERLLNEALKLERLSGKGGRESGSKLTSRAATLQQLGRVALRRGKLDDAVKLFKHALELYEKAYGAQRAVRNVNVASVRHQLGCAASAAHRYDEACEHFQVALAAREALSSGDFEGTMNVAHELQALGKAEMDRGNFELAEKMFYRVKGYVESLMASFELESSSDLHSSEPGHRRTSASSKSMDAETYHEAKKARQAWLEDTIRHCSGLEISPIGKLSTLHSDNDRRKQNLANTYEFVISSLRHLLKQRGQCCVASSLCRELAQFKRRLSFKDVQLADTTHMVPDSLQTQPQLLAGVTNHNGFQVAVEMVCNVRRSVRRLCESKAKDHPMETVSASDMQGTNSEMDTKRFSKSKRKKEHKAEVGRAETSQICTEEVQRVVAELDRVSEYLSTLLAHETDELIVLPIKELLRYSHSFQEKVASILSEKIQETSFSVTARSQLYAACDDLRSDLRALGAFVER